MGNYLIIGGSKGIGFSLAKTLAVENNVWSLSRTALSELNQSKITQIAYDVLNPEKPTFEIPQQLHGLAYCVGSINLKPFSRLTEEDFLLDFKINVLAAVKIIQHVLPALKSSGNASIVLFSTVAVQTGMGYHASVASAKGAVEGLTRSLAAELAPIVRVNCIAPSLTNTPLAEKLLNTSEKVDASNKRHPLGRIGTPEDIASLAEFLLTEKSSWVTGQVFHADGGLSSLRVM